MVTGCRLGISPEYFVIVPPACPAACSSLGTSSQPCIRYLRGAARFVFPDKMFCNKSCSIASVPPHFRLYLLITHPHVFTSSRPGKYIQGVITKFVRGGGRESVRNRYNRRQIRFLAQIQHIYFEAEVQKDRKKLKKIAICRANHALIDKKTSCIYSLLDFLRIYWQQVIMLCVPTLRRRQ